MSKAIAHITASAEIILKLISALSNRRDIEHVAVELVEAAPEAAAASRATVSKPVSKPVPADATVSKLAAKLAAEIGADDDTDDDADTPSANGRTEAKQYRKIGRWAKSDLRSMDMPRQQKLVAAYIIEHGPATTHGIEHALGMKYKSVQSALHQLRVRKLVKSEDVPESF